MRQWTEAEKAQIAECLRRNLTAGQIARRFGGRTRSAVIGLVNRDPALRSVGFIHVKRSGMICERG